MSDSVSSKVISEAVVVTVDAPSEVGRGTKEAMPGPSGAARDLEADAAALLEPIPASKEMHLTFEDVSCYIPAGAAGAKTKDGSERQILHSVSGAARPGEVLAVMGPSGGGKTTLLSILGGRGTGVSAMSGSISYNGAAPTKSTKRSIGFVLQEDLLYSDLTVHETLHSSAQLCLPASMTREEKAAQADGVIKALGLTKCANTIIGGAKRRGVSGGERKRTSVAQQLLTNPSIIFLDEPTSGLDSTAALTVVSALHDLAAGGRTIVTTIHQPSSRIFRKLTKLLVLSEGHTLYYGTNSACTDWFSALGVPCPFGVNVADFLLDLSSGMEGRADLDKAKSSMRALARHGAWDATDGVSAEVVELAPEMASGRTAECAKAAAPGGNKAVALKAKAAPTVSAVDESEASSTRERTEWGASWTTQFSILTKRAYQTRRFDNLNYLRLFQLLVGAVITGTFYWQLAASDLASTASDTSGLLFFELFFLMIGGLMSAIYVFPPEMKIVAKERQSGMYQMSAYYLSRTIAEVPLNLWFPTLFVTIVYFMGGLRLSASSFFINWAAIMLSLFTAESIGFFVGAAVGVVYYSQVIANVLIVAIMLLGGFFVTNIPSWIAWAQYLSILYYAFNILMHAQYKGVMLLDCSACGNSCGADNGLCLPVSPQEALGLNKDPNDSVVGDALILLGMLVFIRFATYVVLYLKTRVKAKQPKMLNK